MSRSKELFMQMREQIAHEIEQVEEGYNEALELYAELSQFEKEVKAAKEQTLETAISEFERYGEKTVKAHGFEFSKTQSGRYTFEHPRLYELEAEQKHIQDQMRAATKLGKPVIDAETGEVYEPAIYTPSKISISVKISKK